jgi:hypothetical protein
MKYNDYSFPSGTNESNGNKNELNSNNNSNPEYISKENQMNFQNEEIEELDGTENLRFKDNNNIMNNINPFYQQRLDSCDSSTNYKYSIDIPNVPKKKLHEYLNEDLLNALDVSPSIPNLNSGFPNNRKISIHNDNNDPNNLMGFSLYNQPNDNSNNNYEQNINNANNYFINNNNINNFQNYNYTNNNSNIINNPKIYVPTKFRNKNFNMNNQEFASGGNNNIQNFKKEDQNNAKNKFDNMNKKNMQNSKKEGKNKKHFEVRAGDWNCKKCNNLNFSFRNKCNRCGIPKELNNEIEPINNNNNIYQNPQLMQNINPNYIYMNNMNINNVNNFNGAKYFQK